jgi:peroxiredoxin
VTRTGAALNAVIAGILLGFLACAAAVPVSAEEPAHAPAGFRITLPKRRVEAPALRLPGLDGRPVTLDSYRGKVVLLHFWATFCVPCRDEMPALDDLWQQYGNDGLVVLGIAADRGSIGVVRDFVTEFGLGFPVLHDKSGSVRNRYEVTGLPTTYLIGRDGRISGRATGTRDWNSPQAREYIESLL